MIHATVLNVTLVVEMMIVTAEEFPQDGTHCQKDGAGLD
jgi:hypothetical protein